jgi:hypothetical protein
MAWEKEIINAEASKISDLGRDFSTLEAWDEARQTLSRVERSMAPRKAQSGNQTAKAELERTMRKNDSTLKFS